MGKLRLTRRVKKNEISSEDSKEIDLKFNWGAEFLKISEVFGFTPSEISDFTVPQFRLYCYGANEQSMLKLDVKSVNRYLDAFFGKKKNVEIAEDDPQNYMWVIKEARDSLAKKTGKKEFLLQEVWTEINVLKKERTKKRIEELEKEQE